MIFLKDRLIRLDSHDHQRSHQGCPAQVCNITRASTTTKEFAKLLQGRTELVMPTFSLDSTLKHGVRNHIVTNGTPVHAQARRLSMEKLIIAKEEFQTLVDLGIVRWSDSPYSSPLHVAPKHGGGWSSAVTTVI